MSKDIRIKRGLDIRLKGSAEKVLSQAPVPGVYAVQPTDFTGITPKLLVKEGEHVLAGAPLFYSKDDERVRFSSPVSGEIAAIVRGAKRKLLAIHILPDKEQKFAEFKRPDGSDREALIALLLESGMWPFIRQRPYAVIANPSDAPKSIHISCFNTEPLAADVDFVVSGSEEDFQEGLKAMKMLTSGKVHLNVDGSVPVNSLFEKAEGIQLNRFKGPHPAGNVGVQIHHVEPINKGEVVWYAYPQDVVAIGRLMRTGKADFSKVVALAGHSLQQRKYFKALPGTPVKSFTDGQELNGDHRVISGTVLTGNKAGMDGYLGFYHSEITVIPEGEEPEFFGWLIPDPTKFSNSRTLPSWLMPRKEYALDTNMHGEERAFVVTGEYEKVFPFDIYPVQLLKSILVEDIEKMEQLGIYEVAEEDFALCEVVCTSKLPVQSMVRKGLDMVRKELS
ncbi:MAG: Na(+)-translocating NADH-quinone reductase subunit A [Flavobacteriia bacterium]|nr:Na(+)-translocating NADH-quinone reductase subunit A [Flavobacteriia bacterium]